MLQVLSKIQDPHNEGQIYPDIKLWENVYFSNFITTNERSTQWFLSTPAKLIDLTPLFTLLNSCQTGGLKSGSGFALGVSYFQTLVL